MDTPATQLGVEQAPWITLALAVAAVAIYASASLESLLVFDRAAIARGEWWRLLSGNLVHFSPAHLAYDVAAIVVAGAMVEMRGDRRYPALLALSALTIGAVIFMALPQLRYFGGLSGMVVAVVVYLCLHGLRERGLWRGLCATTLTLLVFKLAVELATDAPLFPGMLPEGVAPVPLSHAAGGASAVVLYLLCDWRAAPVKLP